MKKIGVFFLALLIAAVGVVEACAQNAEQLSGTWSVGAVKIDGKIYDVHDVDGLEDLYDTVYLWFEEDGTFGYINLYHHNGSYTPFKDRSYLLKVESVYTFKFDGDEVVKETIDSDAQSTYLVEAVGEGDTLRFGKLDPFTGKIKAGATPLFFVKDGSESSYIAQYKTQVSNGGQFSRSSASRSVTTGERNALKQAKLYLEVMPFSYSRLVEQLEYEGYSHTEAAYGAANCGADWYRQAAKAAENYLELMPFSRSRLIEQLEYDGYTYDQAVYGAEKNGY